MNLLFLTFGPNLKNHYQANFAILSFLQYAEAVSAIYVFTDHPEFYQRFNEKVKLVPITEAQLKEWKGAYGFFWRVKIKAIEKLVTTDPQTPIVYLDSDTFLYRNPTDFQAALEQGKALMHENEGKLSERKSKTERKMWSQVNGMKIGKVTISGEHCMWNAGVVAIPAVKNKEAVALALEICDAMCAASVTPRLIEQFALGVALAETYGLTAADKWIGHYWGNKEEWNEAITVFFLESYLKAFPVEKDIDRLRYFDFRKLALRKGLRKNRQRLVNLADKLFPPKGTVYLED